MTVSYPTTENGGTPGGELAIVTDPVESAKAAGLRYVTDAIRGIQRERAGDRFTYLDSHGKPIQEPEEVRRIESLGIPPAWTQVWICPTPRGHLQATGRDAKGRKQYRYHPRWREVRDQTKFDRMIAFGEALPRIRERVAHDLALAGLPREKVLATVIKLLEATAIRVGNEEYVRQNRSFGLTTMRNRHVDVEGSTMRFHFRGKSGKKHEVEVHDRRLARIVKRCRELPGHHLFEYIGDDGQLHTIDSGDVNDYLKEISGQEFTAKDFRTWSGSLLAVRALRELGFCDCATQAKKNVVQAIDRVREQLGNTRAICRKYYVHPAICEAYQEGCLLEECAEQELTAADEGLSSEEAALLRFLRSHLSPETRGNGVAANRATASSAAGSNGHRKTGQRPLTARQNGRREQAASVMTERSPAGTA
jgi:DNA topoisomerase-1